MSSSLKGNLSNRIATRGHIDCLGHGINSDAWGRQKVILDKSIFHGMFSLALSGAIWREWNNGVELLQYSNASSLNGKLHLQSGINLNDYTVFDSFRNPRYQPNRGFIYSCSMFLPDVTANGIRDFGSFTEEAGAFFRLKADGLYACRRTTIDGEVITYEEKIENLPDDIDLSLGNIYDIQMQWRGVGNIRFFIGHPLTSESRLIHEMKHLSSETELNIFNPALPAAFACRNLGDNVVIECGCVDISTEGGYEASGTYGSISLLSPSATVPSIGLNKPILVVRSKRTVDGKRNTRDVLSLLATSYANQNSVLRIWVTRDDTAITLNNQSYIDYRDGHLEYIMYGLNPDGSTLIGTPINFDTSKAELVFSSSFITNDSYATSALFEGRTNIYQTPGDIFIFTIHNKNPNVSADVGVTYEFAEEI